jgi:protein TonB
MKTAIQFLLMLMLFGCAAKPRLDHQAGNPDSPPPGKIEVVSSNLDAPPEPMGGTAAIQAALRAPDEVTLENKEGWVVVEATINASGRVIATKIAQSSGFAGMDSEALLAVARVKWKPGRRRGEPVAATVRVPVVFEK